MSTPRNLRLQIDACRSADELAQPEFRELAAALASDPALALQFTAARDFDDKIAQALHDAPVPEGLAQRILAALPAEADDAAVYTTQAAPAEDAPSTRRFRASRRWTFAALATAASIAAVWLVVASLPAPPALGPDNIFQLAGAWRRDLDGAGRWRDSAPPADHAPSRKILSKVRRWTVISTPYDKQAVAYDFSPATPGGPRITLFVLRTPATGFERQPSSRPMNTQDRSIAAWRMGDLLYVVVVEGGRQQYHQFVDTTAAPVT